MLERFQSIQREFPRQFWILFWGSLVSSTGAGMVFPFVTLFMRERLALPMASIGALMGLMAVMAVGPQVVGGSLSDRYGRKPLMAGSFMAGTATLLGLSLATDPIAIVALLVLESVLTWPLYMPASNAMVADLVEEEKRGQAYGLLRVIHNLGIVMGPSMGGFIIASGSYSLLFATAASFSFVFLVITVFFLRETRPRQLSTGHQDPKREPGYGLVLQDRFFLSFCAISVLVAVIYMQMTTTFPVFLKQERDIPENLWGLLMALNAGMVVLFQFPLTRWSDRFPRTGVLALGAVFYAVGFGSIGVARGFPFFAAAVAVLTVGEMLYVPTGQAFVADVAPEALRGRYMASMGMVWNAGWGVGPVVGGAIMDRWGGAYIWLMTFLLGLAAGVGYLILGRFAHGKELRA